MGIAGGLWRVETRVTPSVSFSIPARKREFCPDGSPSCVFLGRCRGAMGIAGGLWRVKPEPFCLFFGAAVGAQWELRCPLARRDQRFARAFGLGRHTSARSNALCRDP